MNNLNLFELSYDQSILSLLDGVESSDLDNTVQVIKEGYGSVLDGGNGTDLISYNESSEGLYVRLDKGWVTSSDTKTAHSWRELVSGIDNEAIAADKVSNFETFVASEFNDLIHGSSSDENLYGLGGDDYINGGAGVDNIYGGAGDDLIKTGKGWGEFADGGEGVDTLNYYGETTDQGIYVRMDRGWVTDYQNKHDFSWKEINAAIDEGSVGADKFENIENITGTEFKDIIQGSNGDNVIKGAGGGDYINGGSGFDTVSYFGSTADGYGVNVRLDKGFSVSMLDKASYSWSDMLTAIKRGDIVSDKLVNIEAAIGSKYNDSIQGSKEDNYLSGAQGADFLNGGDGDDTLIGGSGSDRLVGGNGNDTFFADETDRPINGGSGFDLIAEMKDENDDGVVDIDLSKSSYSSIEGFIADKEEDVVTQLNVSLDKVARESEGDYDDMFFAIGVDTLTFSERVTLESSEELSGEYEAELVAMLGLDSTTQLKASTYTTENGNTVQVIEEMIDYDKVGTDTGIIGDALDIHLV